MNVLGQIKRLITTKKERKHEQKMYRKIYTDALTIKRYSTSVICGHVNCGNRRHHLFSDGTHTRLTTQELEWKSSLSCIVDEDER